eukprot:TRINITY_DN17156_c0_g1_i1.p1 TRINITY_DN17156_c0_g1~~TRINITY_DN17156_c0_g1_i1.p1  ORF type:complete len:624 (+),score=80.50 TRINITY_DN17156_c0_g1_i1:36-1907(+)
MISVIIWSIVASCVEVRYRCGEWLGPYVPPVRGDVTSKEECMAACIASTMCQGIVFTASSSCYLTAGEDAFNFGDDLSDSGSSFVARKPTGAQSGDCTTSTGSTSCCEVLYPRCGSITASTLISSSTQSSLYDCTTTCYSDSSCNSASFNTQTGSCSLSTNTLSIGQYVSPDSTSSDTEYLIKRSSGSCFQVAEPLPCTPSGCTGITVSPRCGFLRRTLEQKHRIQYEAVTVNSVNTCLKLCGDRRHCKSIQYSEELLQCEMFTYTSNELGYTDDYQYRSGSLEDGPYIIADRPVTAEGNLSTCIPNFSPLICKGDYCPEGWSYRSSDASCFLMFRDIPGLSFDGAQSLCKSMDPHSHLPIITSDEDNTYIADLIGSRKSCWVYAHEYEPLPSLGFITHWGQPIQYSNWYHNTHSGSCALMITPPTGEGKWVKAHCEEKHTNVVCQRFASELIVTDAVVKSTSSIPGGVHELVVGEENVIQITGHNLHTEVWLSLQTTSELHHTSAPNKATGCTKVEDLSGVSAPFQVTVTSGGSSLQNETTAEITIPRSWPLFIDTTYSLCYSDGRPYASPSTPSQYERYSGIDFVGVQEYHERKRALCNMRSKQRASIYQQSTDWEPEEDL